jgi:hypothetical protein
MTASADIIHCPMCDVLHRRAAVTCDGCGQALHEPVDLDRVRDEREVRKGRIAVALVAIAAMLVLNLLLASSIGGFVILTAPLGWLIWNVTRLRALNQRLARATTK